MSLDARALSLAADRCRFTISGAFALLRVRQIYGERTWVNNSNLYIYFFKCKFGLKLISQI